MAFAAYFLLAVDCSSIDSITASAALDSADHRYIFARMLGSYQMAIAAYFLLAVNYSSNAPVREYLACSKGEELEACVVENLDFALEVDLFSRAKNPAAAAYWSPFHSHFVSSLRMVLCWESFLMAL
jgi:hypothetical protein